MPEKLLLSRISLIYRKFEDIVLQIVPLAYDANFIKLKLILSDNSNLRVTERWINDELDDYSYYWLNHNNELIVGWDNAPHHHEVPTFPHHKHVERQTNIQPSTERSLEQVLIVIREQIGFHS